MYKKKKNGIAIKNDAFTLPGETTIERSQDNNLV